MKAIKLTLTLSTVTILGIAISCKTVKKSETLSDEGSVSRMLKEFYTSYINTIEGSFKETVGRPDLLSKRIDSIYNLYLSPELHKYLNEVNRDGYVLDVDPFVGGNMIDKPMLDSMTFKEITNNLYQVRYKYGNSFSNIKLRIKRENGAYKIRDAFIIRTDGEHELTKDEWHK